jgi:hypothetical protein
MRSSVISFGSLDAFFAGFFLEQSPQPPLPAINRLNREITDHSAPVTQANTAISCQSKVPMLELYTVDEGIAAGSKYENSCGTDGHSRRQHSCFLQCMASRSLQARQRRF